MLSNILKVQEFCCIYIMLYGLRKKAKVRNNAFVEDFIATILNGWGFLWQVFTHVNFQAITFEARNLNTSEEWSKLYEHTFVSNAVRILREGCVETKNTTLN